MTYVTGFLTPVPTANKERYIKSADAAWEKMQNDPAMAEFDMPFDGKRMMWGGFEPVFKG